MSIEVKCEGINDCMLFDNELANELMWRFLSLFSAEVTFRDNDNEMGFLGDEVTEEYPKLVKVSVFSGEVK